METDKPAAAADAQVKASSADDATGRLSRALTTRVAPRLVALALGAACILMGLNAALLRLNLPALISGARLAALHGPTVSNSAGNTRTRSSRKFMDDTAPRHP